MSLRLLLDEDSQAKQLTNLLRSAGHDALTVIEAGISGYSDEKVLDYARQQDRILITRNCNDFQELHRVNPIHPGILAIYQNFEPAKNMSYQSIVQAINNLEASDLALADRFVVLNQWNY